MKNNINCQLLFTALAVILTLYSAGCQQSTQTSFTGNLNGYVYDSTGRTRIQFVKVTCADVNLSGYTNDSGFFSFTNIDMPRSEVLFYFNFEKTGYKNLAHRISFKSDVTTTVDSVFMVRDTLK